jgi:hypothetical protein
MSIGSVLSRLFADPWEGAATQRARQEPRLVSANSDSQPSQPLAALPAPQPVEAARFDLRSISPRDFADATHEMYMDGTLSWDEFKMVGFPSELDPRYDETIGALTGEKANPDQPKDMLGQWERRVEFERRYNPDPDQVQVAESALTKMSQASQPPLRLSA